MSTNDSVLEGGVATEEPKNAMEEAVVKLISNSFDNFASQRSGLEDKWREDDKQYQNLMETRRYHGVSRVRVPATYDSVTTLVHFGGEVFSAKDMPVKMKGFDETDEPKVKLYNKWAKLKMATMNMRERIAKCLLLWFKLGTAIVKTPYNKSLAGADFIPLSPFDVYFNLLAKDYSNLDMIIHKVRKSEDSIKRDKKLYNYKSNIDKLGELDPIPAEKKIQEGLTSHAHMLAEMGIQATAYKSHIKYYDVYEVYFKYDINRDGIAEDCIAVLINKTLLVRFEKSPYKRPPIRICSLEDIEGIIVGRSIPRLIREQQIELNDIRSQLNDAGIAALTPMFILDELADISTPELKFRQNGVIRSKGGQGGQGGLGVEPLRKAIDMPSGINLMQIITTDIQKLSGATPSLVDVFSASETTAFESKRALSASTRRVMGMLRRFEDRILKEWIKDDFQYTKDFVTWDKFLRVMGQDAMKLGKVALKDYFDIKVDAIALGVQEIEDKMVKINWAMNAFNVATKVPHIANLPEFFEEVITEIGYEDTSRFIYKTPPPSMRNPVDENKLISMGYEVNISPWDQDAEHIAEHNKMEVKNDLQVALMHRHMTQHIRAMRIKMSQGRAAMPPQSQPRPGGGSPPGSAQGGMRQPAPSGVEESELRREAATAPPIPA